MNLRMILFDIGNVLVELADASLISNLSRRDFSYNYFWETWPKIQGVIDFESGKTDSETFSESVIDFYDLDVSVDEFISVFRTGAKHKYQGVDELLTRLSDSYEIACLTNTNPIHWPKIRDEFGLGRFFRKSYVSYELGLLKPDAKLFGHVLNDTGFEANEVLFVEDNINHVHMAESLGFICCHVDNFENAKVKIENMIQTRGRAIRLFGVGK
jgi:glucose-1-phosphatase